MYTIVIQLGAILCLPIYFRSRIIKFLKTFPKGESGDRTALTHPLTLVIVAFVVTAGPAFLLSKVIGKNLESLKVMGAALLVGGVIMWAVDYFFGWVQRPSSATRRGFEVVANQSVPAIAEIADPTARKPLFARTQQMEEMTWWQAVWIGAAQILSAVFPGTSRS